LVRFVRIIRKYFDYKNLLGLRKKYIWYGVSKSISFKKLTRKYPLCRYILGSGALRTPGVNPKTYGATFISELRHLELIMG
jgi:hypothetical protein